VAKSFEFYPDFAAKGLFDDGEVKSKEFGAKWGENWGKLGCLSHIHGDGEEEEDAG